MHIRYITVSDPRENISVDDSLKILTAAPNVEFGVQAEAYSMGHNRSRNIWLRQILEKSNSMTKPLNIALHINYDWCNDACCFNIPNELSCLASLTHAQTGTPLIQRLQFNIDDGTTVHFDVYKIKKLIKYFAGHEIIFPYNTLTAPMLDLLDKTHTEFSILNDSSYGTGKSPKTWPAPAYGTRHATGYSGGLCATNVSQCLNVVDKFRTELCGNTWVDAEGKLMKPNQQTRTMDINKALDYIHAALAWQK
jgi:hypothetical protein